MSFMVTTKTIHQVYIDVAATCYWPFLFIFQLKYNLCILELMNSCPCSYLHLILTHHPLWLLWCSPHNILVATNWEWLGVYLPGMKPSKNWNSCFVTFNEYITHANHVTRVDISFLINIWYVMFTSNVTESTCFISDYSASLTRLKFFPG